MDSPRDQYEGPEPALPVMRLEAYVSNEVTEDHATRSWVLIDGDWIVDYMEDDPIERLELAVALLRERDRA
jgi:hypothetical protein